MALPSSGTITLLQIQTEFGGNGQLLSYYRGGANVPNTAVNAGVPTSGSISLQSFYGASAYTSVGAIRSPTTIILTRGTTGTLAGNIAVTASGGTGSYTYTTTWLSGGTSITITGASTATPGVTSTSATLGVVRSGVLRTVVSDGTTSVNLDTNVSLEWAT